MGEPDFSPAGDRQVNTCAGSQRWIVPKGGELWGETWRESCKHAVCSPFKEAFAAIMYSLSLQWMKIIQVWYMQTPSSSTLLVISFSSIKLTILVTHDGVHYHHNEGKDGRGEERNERGRGGGKICTTFTKTETSAGPSVGELQKLVHGQKWKNYHYRKQFPPSDCWSSRKQPLRGSVDTSKVSEGEFWGRVLRESSVKNMFWFICKTDAVF